MAIPEYTLAQIAHAQRLSEINWVNDANLPAVFTVTEVPGVYFLNIAKWFAPSTVITPAEGGVHVGRAIVNPNESVVQGIPSNPSNGSLRIVNLVVTDGKLQVEYDDGNP